MTAIGFQVKLELKMCIVWSEHIPAQTQGKGFLDAYSTSCHGRTVLEMCVALVCTHAGHETKGQTGSRAPCSSARQTPLKRLSPHERLSPVPHLHHPPSTKQGKQTVFPRNVSELELDVGKTGLATPRTQPTSRFTEPRVPTAYFTLSQLNTNNMPIDGNGNTLSVNGAGLTSNARFLIFVSTIVHYGAWDFWELVFM